jgi:DNA polymerase-3 subunit beta
MSTLTIPVAHLKASLLQAAKKDIRYYLNGVYIDRTNTMTHAVATDGHRMSVFTSRLDASADCEPFGIIIPRDIIEAAVKLAGKRSDATLAYKQEQWALDGMHFDPIDGKYPDYRKVVPAPNTGDTVPVRVSGTYLKTAEESLNIVLGNPKGKPAPGVLRYPSEAGKAAVLHTHDAFVVLMPIRDANEPFSGMPFDASLDTPEAA